MDPHCITDNNVEAIVWVSILFQFITSVRRLNSVLCTSHWRSSTIHLPNLKSNYTYSFKSVLVLLSVIVNI